MSIAHNKVLQSLILGSVPLVGLIMEIMGVATAFPRSGCLLVAFAIAIAGLNRRLDKELERTKRWNKKLYSERREAQEDEGQSLNLHSNLELQIDDKLDLLNKYSRRAREHENQIQKSASLVSRVEFAYGVFGTLIWGFGDLAMPILARLL